MSTAKIEKNPVDYAVQGFQKTVDCANAVKNDTDGAYKTLQVANYAIMGIEAARGVAKPTTLALQQVAGGLAVIDFAELIFVANYWINGEFIKDAKEGRFCNILGTFAIGGAIIGGAAMWLMELGFNALSSVFAAMGSIPVFGAVVQSVAKVGLGPVVCVTVSIGYFCWAGDSLQTIIQSDVKEERIKAVIDLVSRVADAVLHIIILIPPVGVPAIVVLGLVAKGLALSSFIYGHCTKGKVAETKKSRTKADVDHKKKIIRVEKYSGYKLVEEKLEDGKKSEARIDHAKKVINVRYTPEYTLITHNRGR